MSRDIPEHSFIWGYIRSNVNYSTESVVVDKI